MGTAFIKTDIEVYIQGVQRVWTNARIMSLRGALNPRSADGDEAIQKHSEKDWIASQIRAARIDSQ